MQLPESINGWLVSPLGEVRPALLSDVLLDDEAAAEGGPREIHQTEEEVLATLEGIRQVQLKRI